MKILLLLPTVPHPDLRGELRYYYFLRRLAARHEVAMLALAKIDVAARALDDLRQHADPLIVVDAAPPTAAPAPTANPLPALLWRLEKQRRFYRGLARMRTQLHHLVRADRFDVVLAYGPDLYPVIRRFDAVPLVLDLCDATSLRLRQRLEYVHASEWLWRQFRYRQTRRRESAMLRRTRHVAFISARDRDALHVPPDRATLVPNGVDVAYWSRRGAAHHGGTIVFTGVMDYPPNHDAALYLVRDILPLIRRVRPDVDLILAGRQPLPALVAASRLAGNVIVTDSVSDLRPYLERAAVFVAPMRIASGTQNKILEAMSMSLPVVTTPVAAAGVAAADGGAPPIRVATGAEAFAGHVADLLTDPAECLRLGAAGRDYVVRHFDWNRAADLLEQLCVAAAGARRTDAALVQRPVLKEQPGVNPLT
jgi:polysaccharide biosynthesis protein PslH